MHYTYTCLSVVLSGPSKDHTLEAWATVGSEVAEAQCKVLEALPSKEVNACLPELVLLRPSSKQEWNG